jgi:hypothetical protein
LQGSTILVDDTAATRFEWYFVEYRVLRKLRTDRTPRPANQQIIALARKPQSSMIMMDDIENIIGSAMRTRTANQRNLIIIVNIVITHRR